MQNSLLTLRDLTAEQILDILNTEIEGQTPLTDRKFALLFQKTSLRTRCSFEIGIHELGGFSSYIEWESANFAKADLADEAQVLGEYYDGMIVRMGSQEELEVLANSSGIPVINGMTDFYHPCQTITDLLTIKQDLPNWREQKIVFMGPATNVSQSLAIAAEKLKLNFIHCSPKGLEPDKNIVGDNIAVTHDVAEALQDCDLIYLDAWLGIGQDLDKQAILKAAQPFQLNPETIKMCKKTPHIMHCMPITYGHEVINREFLQTLPTLNISQAKNRIAAQKKLLISIYGA